MKQNFNSPITAHIKSSKLLLWLIIFSLPHMAWSQNEIRWCYKQQNWLNDITAYHNSFLEGVLLTDATEASLYYLDDNNLFANVLSDSLGRVFIDVPSYNISNLLLYDFSLQVGDTIFYNWGGLSSYLYEFNHYKVVIDTSSILINGHQRKVLVLDSYGGGYYESSQQTWIEGYGSITSMGFLNPLQTDQTTDGSDYSFNCITENNVAIYEAQPCYCEQADNIEQTQAKQPILEFNYSQIFIQYPESYKVQLLDATGKVLVSQSLTGDAKIAIDNYPLGVYVLNVSNEHFSMSQKITKTE